MMNNKMKQNNNQYYMICIVLGIIAGCIWCAVMLQNHQSFITDFMMSKELGWLNQVSEKGLFLYILKKRVCCFCILICLSFLFSPRFAVSVISLLWGCYYGMFMSMILFYKNMNQIMNVWLSFFPHTIFYFLSILLVVNLFDEFNTYSSREEKKKKKLFFKYFLKTFVIICCLGMGIFFELNSKFFLNSFFTHM